VASYAGARPLDELFEDDFDLRDLYTCYTEALALPRHIKSTQNAGSWFYKRLLEEHEQDTPPERDIFYEESHPDAFKSPHFWRTAYSENVHLVVCCVHDLEAITAQSGPDYFPCKSAFGISEPKTYEDGEIVVTEMTTGRIEADRIYQ
jgi:hypothetical protein